MENVISNALPNLTPNIKQKLLKTLKKNGVEAPEDWEYITPEDLMPPLNLVQARKLVKQGKLQGTIFCIIILCCPCSIQDL